MTSPFRAEETVPLNAFGRQRAVVREMRVCDLDRVVRVFCGHHPEDLSPLELLCHRQDLLAALSGCIELPPNVGLYDMPLSDAKALWDGFIAVNPDFLVMVQSAVGMMRVWHAYIGMRDAIDEFTDDPGECA